MKKLLSILTLLVVAVTGTWAQDPTLPANATPTGSLDILTGDANVTAAFTGTNSGKKYLTYDMGTTIRTNVVKNKAANWATGPKNDGGGSQNAEFADDVTDAEKYGFEDSYSSYTAWGIRSDRYCGFRVTNCVEAALSTKSNGTKDGRNIQMQVYKKNGESWDFVETIGADKYNSSKAYVLTTSALDANEEYVILITSTYASNSQAFEIRFAAIDTPTLTGAWKIGDEEVTGAELIKGADAPTVPTFIVGATSGTPDAEDYTVAYSLKEGSTAGIFTFTETGGITAISTATAGTATMVATLSSAHIEDFLDADPNTFEYTVTVSDAAAPTFTSVTPSETNVVMGTASTITAVVEGNPDPTVTWYSCDDAEKTNPVEAGTGLVLNLTNDVTGTFYYYAVATNSIGSATSDVQTISVKEKLATPTVSGDRYFLESVTATIEGPDGATIKFTKNGGAEETYNSESKPTSDANMTLVVWAVRDGFIDSDPVTVNFKKVTDTGITAVDEVSSWDWSKPTGTKVEPSPIQLETLLSEITSLNYDEFEPATTSVKYINAQRFDTDNDYVQAHGFIIKTAVSGTLDFKVGGTNSNNRQLIVNGKVAGSVNSSSSKNINDVAIPAGVTLVCGLDVNSQAANNLRFYNVTFTPAVNVTSAGWATATTPSYAVDFDENVEVYIATVAGENITLTKITDAPANTAVVVNAPAGSYTMTKKAEATADVSKNLLKSSDGSIVGTTTESPYVLGKNSSDVIGFGPLAKDVTLAAGKAYILASAFSAAKDFYPIVIGDEENGETTSINSIENGESRIENYDYIYNLAGQKVSKDYKGIVVVNGKKVVRK